MANIITLVAFLALLKIYPVKLSKFDVQITLLENVLKEPKGPLSKLDEHDLRKSFDDSSSAYGFSQLTSKNLPIVITNLNNYLSPFVSQHCLLTIDNFLGIYLLNTQNTPFILRKYLPGLLSSQKLELALEKNTNKQAILWVPQPFTNFNSINTTKISCSSKFNPAYKLNHLESSLCIKINKVLFTSSSKPWNCHVQFSLFPPNTIFNTKNPLHTINTFSDNFGKLSLEMKQTFPSTQPSIHFYLPHKQWNYSTSESHEMDKYWYSLTADNNQQSFNFLSHDIVIALKIIDLTSKKLIEDQKWQIYDIATACPNCYSPDNQPTTSMLFENDFTSITHLSKQGSFSNLNQMTSWLITGNIYYGDDKVLESFLLHMEDCQNFISQKDNQYIKLGTLSPSDRIAHAYAHIWQNIMQNYTYIVNGHRICQNGKWVTQNENNLINSSNLRHKNYLTGRTYFGKLPKQFQMVVDDNINSLRFISCGGERWRKPAYKELLGVFDFYVWLFLLFCIGALVILLQWLSSYKKETTTKISAMSLFIQVQKVVMCLIEQGGAFPDGKTGGIANKFLIVTFSFSAIIISNAYKNKNVYNMISPVKPKPYNKFVQLVDNNFSIYGRTSSVKFKLPKTRTENLDEISKERRHALTYKNGAGSFYGDVVTSEIHNRWMANLLDGNSKLGRKSKRKQRVWMSTDLHPKVKRIYMETLSEYQQNLTETVDLGDVNKTQVDMNVEQLENLFWRKEEKLLLRHLKSCEKTALVLPGYLCNIYMKKVLENKGRRQSQIYIGKEVYFKGENVFTVSGAGVAPSLVERMKGAVEGGLLDWWSEFIRKSSSVFVRNLRKRRILKSPNMGGNIRVIFLVMFVGQFVSLVSFVVENRRKFKNWWKVLGSMRWRKGKVNTNTVIMVKSKETESKPCEFVPKVCKMLEN